MTYHPLPLRTPPEQRGTPTVPYAVQGTLALDLHGSPPGLPETPELDADVPPGLPADSDAEVRGWAARLAQAVVETLGGQRPASQLVRWTAPDVHRDLERRALVVRRAAGTAPRSLRPQVRSVHVCRPSTEVAEVSVHVRHGHRSRAVAMRLEQRGGRWICTVLQFS